MQRWSKECPDDERRPDLRAVRDCGTVAFEDVDSLSRSLDRRMPRQAAWGRRSVVRQVHRGARLGERDLSHDLRQPLATVRALLGRLAASTSLRDDDVLTLARLDAQVDLLSDLLETHVAAPDPVLVDLTEVVRDAVDSTGLRVSATLSLEVLGQPVVVGDPVLLARLVLNLLDNACRAVSPGGRVHVRLGVAEGHVVLDVEDEGPAPGTCVDATGGHGLGLTIVASVAARHGGSAATSPSPLGGLRVRLQLPQAGSLGAGQGS